MFQIQHYQCWQMDEFLKFSIAEFLQIRAILEFSIAAFSQNEDSEKNTLPVSSFFHAIWDESENQHYKPTMSFLWNQHFCVESIDFYKLSRRQRSTIAMLFLWMCLVCQHQQCCFLGSIRIVNQGGAEGRQQKPYGETVFLLPTSGLKWLRPLHS